MNRKIRVAVAMLVALLSAATASAEFRWGPSAGVNISTLRFKQELISVKNIVGPSLGVQGEMMFPGIGFGVDIAALYSMQGAELGLGKWPLWANQGYGNERSYLHTFSIPVSLRFKWTRMNGFEDTLAPFIFGGPVFNFHVAHNNLKAMQYAAGSLGMQCGLGVELKRRWQLQGSYVWGMTYAEKAVQLIDFSAKSSYWNVRLTYLF